MKDVSMFGGSLFFAPEAEEPVKAVFFLVLRLHPLLGHAAGAGGRDDDVLSGAPVGRGRDLLGVRLLERDDDPFDLVKVAPGSRGSCG